MKRLVRDPFRFDGFSLFATYGQKASVSLKDPASVGGFIAAVKASAERALSNEAFLLGQRTEALFERVVASLGGFRLLKREDVGDVFHTAETDVQPPDFRIVLEDGKQLLVEVKNFHQGDAPTKQQRESRAYLDALVGYADLMGCELRMATYWCQWNRWTLVPLSAFSQGEKWSTLSMPDAIVANEMNRLGDLLVGTRAPLRFRVNADRSKPRTIEANGQAGFTIGSCELLSEDRHITDPVELRIAWFLLLYGDWVIRDSTLIAEGDQLVAIEHHVGPSEERAEVEDQDFEFIGALSSMISRAHNSSTGDGGQVDRIRADFEPGAVGALIPEDYEGKALPLWRFIIEPTHEKPGPVSESPG